MKQTELTPCLICKRGVMHDNAATFYRITLSQLVADVSAIKRQHGLELMTGNAAIAHAIGPQEDMAKTIGTNTALLCLECLGRSDLLVTLAQHQDAAEAKSR